MEKLHDLKFFAKPPKGKMKGPVGFGNGYLQAQRDQEVGVEYEQE